MFRNYWSRTLYAADQESRWECTSCCFFIKWSDTQQQRWVLTRTSRRSAREVCLMSAKELLPVCSILGDSSSSRSNRPLSGKCKLIWLKPHPTELVEHSSMRAYCSGELMVISRMFFRFDDFDRDRERDNLPNVLVKNCRLFDRDRPFCGSDCVCSTGSSSSEPFRSFVFFCRRLALRGVFGESLLANVGHKTSHAIQNGRKANQWTCNQKVDRRWGQPLESYSN